MTAALRATSPSTQIQDLRQDDDGDAERQEQDRRVRHLIAGPLDQVEYAAGLLLGPDLRGLCWSSALTATAGGRQPTEHVRLGQRRFLGLIKQHPHASSSRTLLVASRHNAHLVLESLDDLQLGVVQIDVLPPQAKQLPAA